MRAAGRRRTPLARGFTLVELLAVVANIGILAALAMVGVPALFLASSLRGEIYSENETE
ncbi:MAG: prepilin-type N-terminal cleavage/methylation domain-containing protein [Polyangiaceae bacterium]|nr:prepilin-type N-terminal cleavage/methylation domain-containing protein [Polyangiaceae bacterium]